MPSQAGSRKRSVSGVPALERIYPIVWLDAIHYKIRQEGKVVTKAVYTLLGINLEGHKEVLGLYLSESEGATFWLQVLSDLSNRGIEDILIACVDGLKGFPEAIECISYPLPGQFIAGKGGSQVSFRLE